MTSADEHARTEKSDELRRPGITGERRRRWLGLAVLAGGKVGFGIVVAVVFVRRQQTAASPLIDLQLFRSVPFSVTLVMMIITAMLMGHLLVHLALVAARGRPDAVRRRAVAGSADDRHDHRHPAGPDPGPPRTPGTAGHARVLITAIGFVVLSRTTADGGLATVVIGFTLACGGIGGAVALGTDLVVGSAPPAKAGSAASISETSNELGIALGIAILGSIGSIVYRTRLAGAGDAVPEESREAALSGITGAAEAAQQLGGAAGDRLLAATGEAFTSSLTTVATLGAALVLAVVALCSATIARSAYALEPEPEPAEDSAT